LVKPVIKSMKTRILPLIVLVLPLLSPRGARGDDGASPAPPPGASWSVKVFGLLRAGYDNVQTDPGVEFVGQNSGFILPNARIGVSGTSEAFRLSYAVSVDGAVDTAEHVNTTQASLDAQVKDAYVRYEFHPLLGIQFGQFKAPFAAEELREYQDLLFPSRAVAQEGVPNGRGNREPGLAIDRQVGLMLSSSEPVLLGPLSLRYYAMVMNGNGANQVLDDNGKPGLVGRMEVSWRDEITLGASGLYNEHAEGEMLPDLYTVKDKGVALDLKVRWQGVHFLAQAAGVRSEPSTTGTQNRTQLGYHAELGYRLKVADIPLTPAYRFARYEPYRGNDEFHEARRLDYHTLGLRIEHTALPLGVYLAYTLTVEPEARALENNRLEVLGQLTF
jgi:hypothetical protein